MTGLTFGQEFKQVSDITQQIGFEPLIINSALPWEAHRNHTIILGRRYDGHVCVKISSGRTVKYIYLGDATGLSAPIFLKHFKAPEVPKIIVKQVSNSYLASIVMTRLRMQTQNTEIPEVQLTEDEHLVQRIMKFIMTAYGILPYWIKLECDRIDNLLQYYSWSNVVSIYPFLKKVEQKIENVENSYGSNGSIREIVVSDLEVYSWAKHVVINF